MTKKTKKSKAVYAFDLVAKALQEQPVLIVDIEDVHQMKRSGKKQNAFEESISSLWKGNFAFKPSAIAIHPITGDVYMLSSVGNTLVVLFGDGKLRYAIDLKHSQFKQPEGITFDPMGTLFISNESRGGKANIKAFSYIARP